jgi:hypothetical protein
MKGLRILPFVDAIAISLTPNELSRATYSLYAGGDPYAVLESPSKDVLDNCLLGDELDVLDAVTMIYSRADGKMKALRRALTSAMKKKGPVQLTIDSMEIGKPRKSGLTASVSVRFGFSDGQTVTVIFHAPDGDPTKVSGDDMLISYRWMLNGRDVTAWMSPEKDDDKLVDISLATLGMRVSQLIEANSAKFTARQTSLAADQTALAEATDAGIDAANKIADLENSTSTGREELDGIKKLSLDTQNRIDIAVKRNGELQDKLDNLQEEQAKSNVVNLFDKPVKADNEDSGFIGKLKSIIALAKKLAPIVTLQQLHALMVADTYKAAYRKDEGSKNAVALTDYELAVTQLNDTVYLSRGGLAKKGNELMSALQKESGVTAGFSHFIKDMAKLASAEVSIESEPNKYGIGAMGSKLDDYESMEFKDVAKLIRAEIKRTFPAITSSVKLSRYSMGKSLNIEIKSLPDGVVLYSDEYVDHAKNDYDGGFFGKSRYTPESGEILSTIKSIAEQYQYKRGDTNTDESNTNFFLQVKFDSDFSGPQIEKQISESKSVEPEIVEPEAVVSEFPDPVRKKMLAEIYKSSHEDYKGKLEDGTKTILILRNNVTTTTAIDDLTDAEIKNKLGDKKLDSFAPKGSEFLGQLVRAAKPENIIPRSKNIELLTDSLSEAEKSDTSGEAWDNLLIALVKSY